MKKLTILLLSICLLLFAAGCAKEPPVVTTEPTQIIPTTEPAEATEQTEPATIPDLPLLAFSAPVRTYQHHAEDSTLLLTYSYQDFSLILEDPQIGDAIVIDLLNRVDYENAAVTRVALDAQAAYDAGGEWTPFTYSTFFSPVRFDEGILSLLGSHSLYSGSPRPSASAVSVTYDLLTGRQLSLQDILIPDFSADALSQLITASLQELSEQGMLFSDYAYVISDLFSTNRPVESWYLSDTGLCFYFAPYEIAPYSSGTITAEVPYTSLTGLLREEYFPAEVFDFTGTPYILPFGDADLEAFEQFAELVIDRDGQQYLLHTDGCLQDLRIQLGYWLDDGSFIEETTVFAAPALCNGDGIVIHAGEDTAQALHITYYNSGELTVLDFHSATAND